MLAPSPATLSEESQTAHGEELMLPALAGSRLKASTNLPAMWLSHLKSGFFNPKSGPPSWCHIDQRQADSTESRPNCTFVSKSDDNCCFNLLHVGVVYYTSIDSCYRFWYLEVGYCQNRDLEHMSLAFKQSQLSNGQRIERKIPLVKSWRASRRVSGSLKDLCQGLKASKENVVISWGKGDLQRRNIEQHYHLHNKENRKYTYKLNDLSIEGDFQVENLKPQLF